MLERCTLLLRVLDPLRRHLPIIIFTYSYTYRKLCFAFPLALFSVATA